MSGNTNFPTALDGDSQLLDVTDGVTTVIASHHNNTKEAVKAIESKLGIYNTTVPTSLDFLLGHPTAGHSHNGASGQGGPVAYERLEHVQLVGTMVATSNFGQIPIGRSLSLKQVGVAARLAASGATLAFDLSINGVSVLPNATYRPILVAGATLAFTASFPSAPQIPSGVVLQIDVDNVGSSYPGKDVAFTFVFRDN